MRLTKLLMASLIAAMAVSAQDKAQDRAPDKPAEAKPESDAAIIPVATLTGDSFERLVKLLNVFHVPIEADEKLRTIVVYAPKDVLEKVRKVVATLDKPGSEAAIGRNIDMTLAFLKCSTKAGAQDAPLPTDLEPVVRQLRSATQCKDVQLWDTVPLRLQEGKDAMETLRLPSGDFKGAQTIGTLKIHPEGVTQKGQSRSVRFSFVQMSFRIPYATGSFGGGAPAQYNYMDVGLTTSGDFVEGQKTVLGKISGADDESAIFVVVTLKVLD